MKCWWCGAKKRDQEFSKVYVQQANCREPPVINPIAKDSKPASRFSRNGCHYKPSVFLKPALRDTMSPIK